MAKAAEKAAAKAADDDKADTPRPPMLSDYGLALSVYVLYLLGFFTGLTAVIGLIIATMQGDRADPVSRSHFRFQVRTFWIGQSFISSSASSRCTSRSAQWCWCGGASGP